VPSPPWKPGKPTTLIPLGNIDLATQWLPYARKMLRDLALQGDYRRKTVTPVPGVTISIETLGGIPRIIINAGGEFWWWTRFTGFLPPEEGGGRTTQIVAADVPGKIGAPDGPANLAGLYKYKQVFRGDRWLLRSPTITKTKGAVRLAIYEGHDDMNIHFFPVRLGTIMDNDRPQQPEFFFQLDLHIPPSTPVIGDFRLAGDAFSFLYGQEWAVLYGQIGGPTATGGTLVRGRYPTPDDPTDFLEEVTDIDLSTSSLPALPGPNPGAGTPLSGAPGIGFGYDQGNGSFDPLFPPDPDEPKDRDFYFLSLRSVDGVPAPSGQAAVMYRRGIEAPGINKMLTSWLLEEPIPVGSAAGVTRANVYEYQGKVFVIFGRFVEVNPGQNPPDRDWYFDQYVIDKVSGELLHTQLDCGVRMWAETTNGALYGYTMPSVTHTSTGAGQVMAHIRWQLRPLRFGVDEDRLSLFPVLDDEENPVNLLDIVTAVGPISISDARNVFETFNNLILQQH